MYLNPWLDARFAKKTVKELADAIRQWPEPFDSIAIRGVSGGLIGPALAMELDKSIIVVRKGEKAHSSSFVEYRGIPQRFIIVDDLIESGETIAAILAATRTIYPRQPPVCVGVFLYAQGYRGLGDAKHPLPPVFKTEQGKVFRIQ